jgi:type VI secretion system protein ImpK
VRERLAQLLRRERGEYERDLSPHWQGANLTKPRLLTTVPGWGALALCGLLLLGIYLAFNIRLNTVSDPLFAQITAVRVKAPGREAVPVIEPSPRIAQFLEREIQEGLVAVRDEGHRSVITLRGDGLFASGSATLSSEFTPVLMRIADALDSVAGSVLITGHTDNRPIHLARFPSNWHLSLERARSVMHLLSTRVAADRMNAEGRADAEPIVSNDTPNNRARNRRVEITLFVQGTDH